jgi:hypothetical protein
MSRMAAARMSRSVSVPTEPFVRATPPAPFAKVHPYGVARLVPAIQIASPTSTPRFREQPEHAKV